MESDDTSTRDKTRMREENGVIDGVRLTIEDHGILCAVLDIVGDGWGQGYVVTLGESNCYIAIRSILEALGVDSWEKLQGQSVRMKMKDGLIESIGHIYKDRWSERT